MSVYTSCCNVFLQQYHAAILHPTIIPLVAYSILPIPVIGDKIPPRKNIRNPSRAEATPELCRSMLRARVVELGSISPRNSRNTNNVASTIQNSEYTDRVAATARLVMPKQTHPQRNAVSALRNLVTARLPIIIATALTPKQQPYPREPFDHIYHSMAL